MTKTFDVKCYELAEHFLPDDASETTKEALAIEIQGAIEDFLEDLKVFG